MRKQMNQLKSTMNSLNHELQSVNELLREERERNEKLVSMQQLHMSDLEYQKKLTEKMNVHVSEMRERNEILESNLQSVESNKSSLMKENNRLRNTINSLSREKKKLDEMEPLYLQQLEHLASIHSKTTELETMLGRMTQWKRETVLQLLSYEMRYGRLERRYKELLVSYHHSSMVSEDLNGQRQKLQQQLEDREFKIKLLKQDLSLSKQAEPFVVKKLNYLLSKLNGEKNHYQQKVSQSLHSLPLSPV
jgi:chromosome segregation ATPase